jgi:iron complex outermembrane recepter protein
MRIARSTLIGTAVAMALFGRDQTLHAQVASSDQSTNTNQLQEVVVTGIRASLEASLEQQRKSDEIVQVVTAEDIGKMPDKNVADALQRLPGVTISSAGANEGGFDEADRVSMKGTNPSLTLTLINGHSVASGDWFVLDQTGTVGRSVSYTLLPAEIVSSAVVYQTSEASLIEGGTAGTVDIITRKPTDFQQQRTFQVSAGAVYADLPDKTTPQFNALGNWLNDDRTFGFLGQVFYEARDERRDGQELLGYGQISPGSNLATAHPDLANAYYPLLLGAPLFQQQRQRQGGLADLEWQPNDSLTVDLNGFYSKLDMTNLNDNYLLWGTNIINEGNGQACPTTGPKNTNGCVPGIGLTNYTVQNGTLTSATFAPYAGTNYGVYDQISRPDESASTMYGDLDINWKATDQLNFLGQLGVTEGHGRTPTQDVSETLPGVGAGAAYTMYGTTSAATWNLGPTINTSPNPNGVPVAFSWIFGDQNMDVVDKETYAKIDGAFNLQDGAFKDFKFGVRYADHQRHLWNVIGQGPGCDGEACPANVSPEQSPSNPANYPTGYSNYPTNYGYGLGGPFPTNIWYWTPAQLAAYNASYTNRNPVSRADWTSDYGLEEKDTAVYAQLDFKGDNWSGNVGVRGVQTKESVVNNVGVSAGTPGAITTSAFGPYTQETTNNTYNDVLPTANFKFNLSPDLLGRIAGGQTLSRPDYSALASSISLGAPPPPGSVGSGTGANPNLAPIKSTNGDVALEWYFAPRALLSADVFYMHLQNYVTYASETKSFFTQDTYCPNGCYLPYLITVPVNATGQVYGAQFSYQQPILEHFGIILNYTYADGRQTSELNYTVGTAQVTGDSRLVGTSKHTGNAIAYYESAHFSARVAYNYRSAFYSGLDRSSAFTQDGIGTLDANLTFIYNETFSVSLDGLNLNNPTLKYYALNEDQPRAFYKNGSQYYAMAHFKF